jgi:predicted ABC-type ATPase
MKRGVRILADRRIVIIAGPNGAGKTTFALEFLPNEAGCPAFVNADLIAAGLSPFVPDLAAVKAGRLMLEAIAEHEAKGESFAFETTLSGRIYARRIPRWQAAGYHVALLFLALPSPEFAIERVKERVRQGGHDVPEIEIRRRFDAGLRNFQNVYRDLVDAWSYYDNSGTKPVLVNWGEKP